MTLVRVDILLPQYYNDDYPIETEKYIQTLDELFDQFKGGSLDSTPIVGKWEDPKTKEVMIDENITYWIICGKTSKNLTFLKKYEAKLRKRFEQRSMMIYYWTVKML